MRSRRLSCCRFLRLHSLALIPAQAPSHQRRLRRIQGRRSQIAAPDRLRDIAAIFGAAYSTPARFLASPSAPHAPDAAAASPQNRGALSSLGSFHFADWRKVHFARNRLANKLAWRIAGRSVHDLRMRTFFVPKPGFCGGFGTKNVLFNQQSIPAVMMVVTYQGKPDLFRICFLLALPVRAWHQ